MEFWSGDKIREYDADYNIVFGERSNGKTYDTIKYVLDKYIESGDQFIIMRRNDDEIIAPHARYFLSNHVSYLRKKLDLPDLDLTYYSGGFYLYRDKVNKPKDKELIGYTMSVSGWTKYKGNAYPDVTTVILDEFLSTKRYVWENSLKPLQEFNDFLNNISTIVRDRDNVKVYLLGNTVTRYSPYFDGFNIDPFSIKRGSIVKFVTASGAVIAVEHCKGSGGKRSDKMFKFGESGKMITEGEWEINSFPASFSGCDCDKLKSFSSYKRGIKIKIKQGGHSIGCIVPVKLELPLLLLDKLSKFDLVIESLSELGFYTDLKQQINYKLNKKLIVSQSDYATEIFSKKLKK